ncbi:hypothetical protein WMO40_20595 [Bacillaceae bacterium CLA-AA-H227]|uniref:Uncharacterized protein n=1 Tax=Robertmurraya yapensis (ex Hitch et al 2024) TaxID=3133160 RepID=A0ACC6SG62_9BACI
MTRNQLNIEEIQRLIVHSNSITPQAKGRLGIILFKVESKLELDKEEQSFLDEILMYLQVS